MYLVIIRYRIDRLFLPVWQSASPYFWFVESADVLATKDALIALGVEIIKTHNGDWQVNGVGMNGMVSPLKPLDLGNSGTGVRLLMGVVAGQDITATFGDASLSTRHYGPHYRPALEHGRKHLNSQWSVASYH